MSGARRRCKFCQRHHAEWQLCDPARRVLDGLIERGMRFDMPTLEFPEPIQGTVPGLGDNPGDTLLSQVVVMGAVIEAAGVPVPAVIITGRTPHGEPLPRWIYVGDDDEMTRFDALIHDMTQLAMRRAAEARAAGQEK